MNFNIIFAQSELPPYVCGHRQTLQSGKNNYVKVLIAGGKYSNICYGCYEAQRIRLENEYKLNKKGSSQTIFIFQ